MPWRFLSTPPLDGATNMGADMVLMDRARRTGESVLRTYGWVRPTLSLGRNQNAAGSYDREHLASRGIDVVRRPTGGRAILHWREVTYSVTAPAADGPPLRDDYERINQVLLHALHALGVPAGVAGSGSRASVPGPRPCFAEPSQGEIVLEDVTGGKLVGSAQLREGGVLLQHGSILLHDDQALLAELTGGGEGRTAAATLSGALGRDVPPPEVEAALFAAARTLLDAEASELDFSGIADQAAVRARDFRDSLWTWRR